MADSKHVVIEETPAHSSHDASKDAVTRQENPVPEQQLAQENQSQSGDTSPADALDQKKGFFAFLRTKEFYLILLLGQVLAILNTSTSTFTSLLQMRGTSIPAFQTFFTYVVLNVVFTSITLYKYGIKKWARLVWKDGWRYIIFAFFDVEGNYFIVLAYRYTNIMSAQLINFWAIVVVMAVSFILLHVRYHYTQIIGILICIGGMGVLIASDHLTGSSGQAVDPVKGDLFALLASTCYGLSNVTQEYLVSKRPMYEVVGQLAFWAMFINGTQAAIFDRQSFRDATWNGAVAGYLVGFTICLSLFYATAPLIFRLASAALLNLSMLTGNFWGVIMGVEVLGLSVHWMYPIAYVLIMLGHFVYYLGRAVLGEARKPWLGKNQEKGVSGVFTARRWIEQAASRANQGNQV